MADLLATAVHPCTVQCRVDVIVVGGAEDFIPDGFIQRIGPWAAIAAGTVPRSQCNRFVEEK